MKKDIILGIVLFNGVAVFGQIEINTPEPSLY